MTAVITTGLQPGALASEATAPSVGETVQIAGGLGQVAETTGGVSKIAPADATKGIEAGTDATLTLPDAADLGPRAIKDGIAVYQNTSDRYSVAVNPFAGGTQVLTVLADKSAPTSFSYGIAGPGQEVILDEDGGAGIVDTETGETIAAVDAPWAVDANGVEVATRYLTDGSNLVQVVDHRQADIAYPVTADPKYFTCDAYTHLCVKFSKSETKKIRNRVDEGASAAVFAAILCTGIPALIGKAACGAAVALAGTKLRKSFQSAAKNGKCIELHFFIPSGVLTRWKTVKC